MIVMRVHLFPSRTQKLSSCTLTILGGRLPGKIGNANTSLDRKVGAFFIPLDRWIGPPVSCCGARQKRRLSKQACFLPTAATRSGRFIRHRRRFPRSPSRTQKLSSCTLTILGGRLPGKIGNANTSLHSFVEAFSYVLEQMDWDWRWGRSP